MYNSCCTWPLCAILFWSFTWNSRKIYLCLWSWRDKMWKRSRGMNTSERQYKLIQNMIFTTQNLILTHYKNYTHKLGRVLRLVLRVRGSSICTCAGLTAGVTLFANTAQPIKALWAAFHTQFGPLQLQEGRWTGPAGLRPWSCALLTGPVTILAVGILSVIPEEIH